MSSNKTESKPDLVKYNLKQWEDRDMKTFFGRWMHFFSVTKPANSFYDDKTIRQYNTDVKEV